MLNKKMSYAHNPKTLVKFKKENEQLIRSKVELSDRYEQGGLVYATIACAKSKVDLAKIKHLLVGNVAGV